MVQMGRGCGFYLPEPENVGRSCIQAGRGLATGKVGLTMLRGSGRCGFLVSLGGNARVFRCIKNFTLVNILSKK